MNYKGELDALIGKYKGESEYLRRLSIHVGANIIESTFKYIEPCGKTVLFCTGHGAMKKIGAYDRYMKLFNDAGIEVVPYNGVSANPTAEQIEKGVKLAKDRGADFIFALGGGSVIDTSKAIAVGIYGNVWDYVEKKAEVEKALAILAHATTSGTGSHVTPYAVISNSETKEKKTLKHDLLLPKLSLVDVDLLKNLPAYVIATTGFDVLCHAVEVYTNPASPESANAFALRAIDLVNAHLYNSFKGENSGSKEGMAYADIFAGIALSISSTHVAHAISHPISGRFPKISHGQALAYIMPKTIEMHARKGGEETKRKLEDISRRLGGSGDCVETITELVKKLGLDKPVVELSEEDKKLIYEDVRRYRWGSVERSPHPTTEEDIKEIIFNSM